MSPLYLYNGKLLVENGALANNINCCCSTGCPTPPCTGIQCAISDLYGEIDCNRAGIHKHTITIPEEYSLPVQINITGGVDDDLLIDGQSASATYEPGSYIDPNTGCIQAHTIGDQPGPFKDPVHGGITFPMNNRTFEVAARDTLRSVHALDITICIDPDNTQNVCLPVIVSGCCNSGVELYCYEKTVTVPEGPYGEPGYDCVTRICATGIPEGEDWTQVGGPFDCGCTDCAVTGNCITYTGWKIIDQNNYVYASGSITYDGGNGLLNDLPNPFTPLFYGSVGEKNFKLQGYCSGGGAWHNLEPWDGTIVLCSALAARYPSRNLSGPWAPQGACSKPVNEDGDFVCDINGSSSSNCPSLVPGTAGDGQAWRDPQPGAAYKFTGSVDGEWTNLNNWQDSSGLSPAASLPDTNSSVIIDAPVTSVPSDYTISVDSLTVNGNGVIYVWIWTNSLTVYGKIGCLSPCNSEERSVSGTVVVNGSTSVFDGGILEGNVVAPNATTIFKNTAYIQAIGWTECDDLNRNCGYLTGDAEFNTGSFNDGYVNPSTSAGVVFNDDTQNRRCADGTVTFNDNSSNTSTGTVLQMGIFNDSSANEGTVGIATFNDSSFNHNIVLNTGDTAFNDSSRNSSTGKIKGNAIFNNTSSNAGDIDGNATFNNSSRNDDGNGFSTVTIGGNLLFKDTSYNITNNTYVPVVGGTTTFEDSSSNRGGMSSASFTETSYNDVGGILASGTFSGSSYNAGTVNSTTSFANNSYNTGTVNGDASIGSDNNSTSYNSGTITGAAQFIGTGYNSGSVGAGSIFNGNTYNNGTAGNLTLFTGDSYNNTGGVVNGNASFNSNSRNKGNVTGTASFAWPGACNDGGTAGTFIPPDANCV